MSKSTTGRKLLDDLEKRVAQLEREVTALQNETRIARQKREAKAQAGLTAMVREDLNA